MTFKNFRKRSQISVLTIYFHELDHSEWFGAKKILWKILTDGRFWSLWAHCEKCIFWTEYFQGLTLSGMLLPNIIYRFWEFQKNQFSKNLPKKFQSVNYGHFWPLWLPGENCNFWRKIFPDLKFSGIVLSNIIYHFWEFQKHLGSKRFFSKFLSGKMQIIGPRWKIYF